MTSADKRVDARQSGFAKVYAAVPEEGIKQVDFLSGIVGLDTDGVRERAAKITLADGVTIPLLHPLDVLESCLRNMDALPSKQNETGAAQTHASTSSSGRDSGRDFNARKIEFAALQERRRKLCGALRKKAGFAQEK